MNGKVTAENACYKAPFSPIEAAFNVSLTYFIPGVSLGKMQFFTKFTLCIVVLYLESSSGKNAKGVTAPSEETPFKNILSHSRQATRAKRLSGYIITDCIVVTSEEGKYHYKAYEDSESVCGVYFLSDPDEVIEIHFENVDVPCETGGLISFLMVGIIILWIVDGWELDGEYFPSLEDHKNSYEDRYQEFCGLKRSKEKKSLLTSQNAGLVQYKLPKMGSAFTFTVKFIKIGTPCNILNEGKTNVYTLRNYGRPYNCSFLSIVPSKVKILALNVGISSASFQMETGSLHKCSKRGLTDSVLVGGNEGLDIMKMTSALDICGMDSTPQDYDVIIACNMTTVKLISSGKYDNSVTFMITPVEEEDLLEPSLICGL